MKNDTVVAIATPMGYGGVGIIRVSGEKSYKIIDKIFYSEKLNSIAEAETHTIYYGTIKYKEKLIDKVLIFIMKKGSSYTNEDVVEISCHGNPFILDEIVKLIVKSGARIAEPGEFTKRAYLNNRLDLTQVESVLDVMNAKTENALNSAVRQLAGGLGNKIKKIEESIKNLLMFVEADIDFSEDEIELINNKEYKEKIKFIIKKIDFLRESYKKSNLLRNGLVVVIAGSPNTGKSSLLNAILKDAKAIVTDIPGTTRDALEYTVNIKGIHCRLVDTAGIREAEDIIEKEGIRRTKQHIEQSHAIIFLLDASRKIEDSEIEAFKEIELLEKQNKKQIIIGINKIDIKNKEYVLEIKKKFKDYSLVEFSAKTMRNIDALESSVVASVLNSNLDLSVEYMVNARQKDLLEKIKQGLENAEKIDLAVSQELCAFELKEAMECLGEITGKVTSEDILDMIFSGFCIGK
jgi:tRNA modification GTPase